jgi:hypothetical protein
MFEPLFRGPSKNDRSIRPRKAAALTLRISHPSKAASGTRTRRSGVAVGALDDDEPVVGIAGCCDVEDDDADVRDASLLGGANGEWMSVISRAVRR